MYKEKLLDNVYGIDIITYQPNDLYKLHHSSVVHVICHHIMDEEVIKCLVQVLLEIGCKIYHLFGQQHNLWKKILKSYGCDDVVVIDYFSELEDFEMDLVTHFIEKKELIQYHGSINMQNRIDYLLYDDIGFFWGIQEDVEKYYESQRRKDE